jgi:hypothetical protein
MIRYLTAGAKHAFGLHRPGRRLPVQADDILLASYPQSGEVWTQFLIANLIAPGAEVSAHNVHKFVLDFDLSVKLDFDRAPRPRFIKSHSSFDPRYRRVIYVVRDPRDVADPFSTDDFGSWGENAGSWLAARSHDPGFFLLRYEDLVADTTSELVRLTTFAGLAANPETIAHAIRRSAPHAPAKTNWRNDLTDAQAAKIEAAWGDIMACLGYELVTRDSQSALDSSLIGLLAGASR